MTCSKNLFEHLKFCYQTKTNKEMSQHDFKFFSKNDLKFCKSNDFFLKKEKTKYFLFIFIFHICEKFKKKEKKNIMACAFECFQSHCQILNLFLRESIFIFSFVVMDW
jgi:hypothetical protein